MSTSIHPYKGYLNTQFRVFIKGEIPLSFQVYSADKEDGQAVLDGVVEPNQPYSINLQSAGEYVIKFEDGSTHSFRVEDGYRYGGNKLKNAFIFDNCPWAFVVMHDRTYFYNRQTQQSFVEPISPDDIEEIAPDYVVFKSNKYNELTLFSLELQEPVLWVDNIVFHTNKVLCWKENKEDETENDSFINLVLYSIIDHHIATRISCDKYSFDKKKYVLYYHTATQIHNIDLDTLDDTILHQYKEWETFVTFVSSHYAVSYTKGESKLYILDIQNLEARGEVAVKGSLARVNDVTLINISQKVNDYRNFDFNTFRIPEASIQALYTEINIYPCDWTINENFGCKFRTFYAEKVTTLNVSQGKYRNIFSQTESTNIKSIETDFLQNIDDTKGDVMITDEYFLFHSTNESLVIPRRYPHRMFYNKGNQVLVADGSVIMKLDEEIRMLNRYGLWNSQMKGKFDTSYFADFQILKNIDNEIFYMISGSELGELLFAQDAPTKLIKLGEYVVYPGGEYIVSDKMLHFVSPLRRLGLTISDSGVALSKIKYHKVACISPILQDVFDTQQYTNVLLGENGQQVIYRDDKQSKMLDLASGVISEFDNLSFINHINGIRPLFRLRETSQALLINPIDGQPINFDLVNEYQFVSPDYHLYADKALGKYVEYYDHIQQKLISLEQYRRIYERFSLFTSDDTTRDERIQNRKDFVSKHSDFLIGALRRKGYKERPVEEFHRLIIDEKNSFDTSRFVDLFIEKRGVAVIKSISDDIEVARIPLGPPLWFLNYVSFSRNSRYVAIAGRYRDGIYGGLFLVYDLVKQKAIIDSKSSYAVWTTAFTKDDVVAAYTSTPNSFVRPALQLLNMEDEKYEKDEGFNVRGFNFLTFSPDGKYYACSQQGYIRYKMPDGTIRLYWGHQPSSLVSIRYTKHPNTELLVLNDLDEEGIAETHCGTSVASISFSNDNSRIMMVGRNGVVVVRNIDLNHYASK